ncbi:MAG: cell wall-binding repeat-containing protein [Actinomycetota bacterium]|nr:cell wall-binding repeat-containing protein [Actinomycetota bacterium]
MPRPRLLIVLLVAALAAAGCGREEPISNDRDTPALLTPQRELFENLGFPDFATKNTTRVAGANATQTAAATVRAVFPDARHKPSAVTLVDTSDWRVAVAASALTAAPINAPLLFSDGNDLPSASRRALAALDPRGSKAAGNAQVIRIGGVAKPPGRKTTDLTGANALALTRSIAGLIISAKSRTAPSVIVTTADDASIAAPAAAYAAKSGTPVLFVNRKAIPPETRAALAALARPRIYLLGSTTAISPQVTRQLRRLGRVQRFGEKEPVANAVAVARFREGSFGWGIVDPGHGLVFARSERPLDAVAASALSSAGTYGPLLLLDAPRKLPVELQRYLLDIQPGYAEDPVRGVYNHGWIVGDRKAITIATQTELDALLEIVPVRTPDAPPDQPQTTP